MLLALLPLKVVLVAALGAPPAVAAGDAAAAPVEVTLFDYNHKDTYEVRIGRDGSVDDATRTRLEHAFRCRRSHKEHAIDQGLLAMIADIGEHWPGKTIEYVSAYRGWSGERHTSPHRAGRAFDFRLQGVSLIELRDWAWEHLAHVGVGWYPDDDFVHIDHRPTEPDIAWTERAGGSNHYHPSWAARVREHHVTHTAGTRVGL